MYHDNDRPIHDTSSTEASNGASDDESGRIGRRAADGRPELEDDDEGEKDLLGRIESVHSAEEQHETGGSKVVRTAVPACIAECMEMIGDIGYGGGDDGAVLEGCQQWLGKNWP